MRGFSARGKSWRSAFDLGGDERDAPHTFVGRPPATRKRGEDVGRRVHVLSFLRSDQLTFSFVAFVNLVCSPNCTAQAGRNGYR